MDDMDIASSLTEASMEKILLQRRQHLEAERRRNEHAGVVMERECESCGEMIDPRRLKIMPSAKLCISCQKELE